MASIRSGLETRSNPRPHPNRLKSRLLDLLEERDLSRSDLSRLTEIPYRPLRRLLRQEVEPSLEHALRICRALGVEVEEVFALEHHPASSDRRRREGALRRRSAS
jgi:transcriptional regulator with XRE-family HTH domain